jgi:hypothetical protein
MARLILYGSVGTGKSSRGIPHNLSEDVIAVVSKFVSLGYTWIADVSQGDDNRLINVIRLFQSIIKGSGQLNKGDGRINHQGLTHRWLAADNAPKWIHIFGQQGEGWFNTSDFSDNNGGYCTSWLRDSIINAGIHYNQSSQLNQGPQAPSIWIRECSPIQGGRANGHASHQTGLDVDMRLPILPPDEGRWAFLGQAGYLDNRYDRNAARNQLIAVRGYMNPALVFFNDPILIRERLCRTWPNHQHHFHIRIKPPAQPANYDISTDFYTKMSLNEIRCYK